MADRPLNPLPYYKWYWQDFRANRTVQRMSYVERGLYRELLDECWAEGGIPTDMESIADICGCPVEVMTSAWQVLGKCFRLMDGRFYNEKLHSVRTAKDAERVFKADAGKAGGIAKSLKRNEPDSTSQASAKQVLGSCHIEEKRREEKSKGENKKHNGAVAPVAGAPPSQQLSETKKPRQKKQDLTLTDWLTALEGSPAVPENDPIYAYAETIGLDDSMIAVAWAAFKGRYSDKPKKYKDWRAAFRDHIQGNFLKLWYFDDQNMPRLTTAGIQAKRLANV